MKSFSLFITAALACSSAVLAQAEQPLLAIEAADLHESAVVFSLGGDLWLISAAGETAEQLTEGPALDDTPLFSPDGGRIAFTRRVHQNTDVYSMELGSREISRHTWHPDVDTARAWKDASTIIFSSQRGGFFFSTLHTADINSPEQQQIRVREGHDAALSASGELLAFERYPKYHTRNRGYHGEQRGEILVISPDTGQLIFKAASAEGHFSDPVWVGNSLYCIATLDGTANLYRVGPGDLEQVTTFEKWDVQMIEADASAILLVQNGRLHRYDPASGELGDIPVNMPPLPESTVEMVPVQSAPGSYSVAPSHDQLALEYMGEILILHESGQFEQVTRSPGRADRSVIWSPDGEKLAWLQEAADRYRLTLYDLAAGQEEYIELPQEDAWYFNPVWSPDGTWIALNSRNLHLWLVNTRTKEIRHIATSPKADQDSFHINWAPEGRLMAFMMYTASGIGAVHIYDPSADRLVQVSPGIRHSHQPLFSTDGKTLFYLRDHARVGPMLDFSLGSRLHVEKNLSQILYLPTTHALKGMTPGMALPLPVGRILDLFPDDENSLLVHAEKSEQSLTKDSSVQTLYRLNLKTMEAEEVFSSIGFSQQEHGGVLTNRGPIFSLVPEKAAEIHQFDLRRLQVASNERQVWRQIFNEHFNLHRHWFYDPGMHGQDMQLLADHFAAYLPHLRSRYELNVVLQEAISHLSATHMGIGGGIPSTGPSEAIGTLGADFELMNGAWQISRIYTGDPLTHEETSPLALPGVDIQTGDWLLAVNDQGLDESTHPYQLLVGTAGRETVLTVAGKPDSSASRTVTVQPLANDDFLRWMSWVHERRAMVHQLSDGKLAYIYIPDFRDRGLESFIQQLWSQRTAAGVVIDQRFSRGGVSGDILIDYLRRSSAFRYIFRAGQDQRFPQGAMYGPKVLITHELNTSSSDTFPLMFKEAGLGPIVGRAPFGAAIGGYFTLPRFIDGGGMASVNRAILNEMNGQWLENNGVVPDIRVDWFHEDWLQGKDPQLERAVEEALKLLPQTERPKPNPDYPDFRE